MSCKFLVIKIVFNFGIFCNLKKKWLKRGNGKVCALVPERPKPCLRRGVTLDKSRSLCKSHFLSSEMGMTVCAFQDCGLG